MASRPAVAACIATAFLLTTGIVVGAPDGAAARASSSPTKTTATDTPAKKPASTVACKAPALRTARFLLEVALSTRVTQLQTLGTRISDTSDISATELPKLKEIVSEELTGYASGGINGLEQKVAKAASCGELITDGKTMVKDFWVYALASPQVDLTAVTSVESTVDAQLVAIEPEVEASINAAIQRGADESQAQAEFSSLQSSLAASIRAVGAVSIPTLLSQQPSEFPGDLSLIVGYHQDVVAAGADLGDVSSDLRLILGTLS